MSVFGFNWVENQSVPGERYPLNEFLCLKMLEWNDFNGNYSDGNFFISFKYVKLVIDRSYSCI